MAPRKASSAAPAVEDVLDLRATVVPLLPARIGADGYTATDRHRDFNAVFINGKATAQQRERVLYQILDLCRMNVPIADATNVNQTYLSAGRQEVGMWLLRWLTQEPREHG